MRWALALATTALLAPLGAAPAAAAPTITAVELRPPAGDRPAVLAVTATDPDAPVSGVTVVRPGAGRVGVSACRIGATAAGPNTLSLPLPGSVGDVLDAHLTVTSGGCTGTPRSTSVALAPSQPAGLPAADMPDPPPPLALPLGGPLAAAAGACPGADLIPRRSNRKRLRRAVVCLVNAQRRASGLRPLRPARRLRRAAARHSSDMRKREYFAHVGPGGRPDLIDRLKGARYWPASASENIGAGTEWLATPRSIVEAWMLSSGHRSNLLAPGWRRVGVGVVTAYPAPPARPGGTYTAVFGRR